MQGKKVKVDFLKNSTEKHGTFSIKNKLFFLPGLCTPMTKKYQVWGLPLLLKIDSISKWFQPRSLPISMPQYFLLSLFKAEILIYFNSGLVLNFKSVLHIEWVQSSEPHNQFLFCQFELFHLCLQISCGCFAYLNPHLMSQNWCPRLCSKQLALTVEGLYYVPSVIFRNTRTLILLLVVRQD